MHIVGIQINVSPLLTAKHKYAIIMAYNMEIQICYTPFQTSPERQKKDHTVSGIQPYL